MNQSRKNFGITSRNKLLTDKDKKKVFKAAKEKQHRRKSHKKVSILANINEQELLKKITLITC